MHIKCAGVVKGLFVFFEIVATFHGDVLTFYLSCFSIFLTWSMGRISVLSNNSCIPFYVRVALKMYSRGGGDVTAIRQRNYSRWQNIERQFLHKSLSVKRSLFFLLCFICISFKNTITWQDTSTQLEIFHQTFDSSKNNQQIIFKNGACPYNTNWS